ncbi:hypothetical protein [Gemmata sp.]|uniref:hypothetical protein n=1 Tax=Gemmata sp. TaxID=1914242 RepID=UPI003F6EF33B
MHAIQFNKQHAQDVLAAIQSGEPIPSRTGGWSGHDMLAVAGILYAAVFTQGPHKQQALGLSPADLAKVHPERREAVEESFERDLAAALEFARVLAFKVIDGKYDPQCEAEVTAVVTCTEGGQKRVQPVAGFKAA